MSETVSTLFAHSFDYVAQWPVVVLIVAFCFRGGISEKIKNGIIKFSAPGGSEVSIESRLESQEKLEAQTNTPVAEIVPEAPIAPSSEELQNNVNNLTQQLSYEKVKNLLFGSQMYLLRQLRIRGDGYSISELQKFYQDVQATNPVYKDYAFDGYVGFLKTIGYIKEETLGKFEITESGIKFVDYIVANKYPDKLPW